MTESFQREKGDWRLPLVRVRLRQYLLERVGLLR
jgi:hypothetical protein